MAFMDTGGSNITFLSAAKGSNDSEPEKTKIRKDGNMNTREFVKTKT